MPPYYSNPELHDRGGSKYTQNLSLVITEHLKLISCKKISYGAWETAKVGRVADFLLRFCLKIGCNFTFYEMR